MTMRKVGSGAPVRPRYPRFGAAWRLFAGPILLAPTLANADATPPPPQKKEPCPPQKKHPQPDPDHGKHPRPPMPGGMPAPQLRNKELGALLLHPHGPDEPCFLPEDDDTRDG